MVTLLYVAIFIFTVLIAGMSWTYGTLRSISALALKWRWLLLITLWSLVLILPVMLEVTAVSWQWLAVLGVGAVIFAGATNVWDKTDYWVHIISAVVSFVTMTAWVMITNSVCLLPLIICIASGRENWQWRIEVGLIISVYMTLITKLGIVCN